MTGIQLADFAPLIDIKKDSLGLIQRGLTLGDTLNQNQAIILAMHQGELKERPMMGVGISDMLLDNDPIYWRTMIKEQLEMDGEKVGSVKITRTGIQIEAKY
ncbi:MAG: hypothetical protein KBT34_13060 [Prevotella sp.]|nr:hypothetical protein [Candidatus Prevotella equi]